MKPFEVVTAADEADAIRRFQSAHAGADSRTGAAAYIAGGTTVVDLLKLNALQPNVLIDLGPLRSRLRSIVKTQDGIRIGAMATMTQVAQDPDVARHFPAAVESLRLAASGQIRNMATLGGNLLQRTRCSYFRDGHAACNKRKPGTGCAAIGGASRGLAILGVSQHCIANYPGDLAVALVALDATIQVLGTDGSRNDMPVASLYRLPEDSPHIETHLAPGDLITSVTLPFSSRAETSLYLKIRDRWSYAFALASAAVAVELDEARIVRSIRIVLGGLASVPWRCEASERYLLGKSLDAESAGAAADLAVADARTDDQTRFKPELGRRTVIKALLDAGSRRAGR